MRVAVAGGTGLVGNHVVAALRAAQHEPVIIARSAGIDVLDRERLSDTLKRVEAVIDVTNSPATDAEQARSFFGQATHNLLAAERAAHVRHHVILSILGLDRVQGNANYAGKRLQEQIAQNADTPVTIVRAAQFFEFAEMVVSWTRDGHSAVLAPLLIQPLAVGDLAHLLTERAIGHPANATIDVAGPEPQDLVDMARRTLSARGHDVRLIPSWRGPFGTDMAGEALLPGPDAHLTTTTFDDWLSELAFQRRSQ
jgi:uncharacterized protein YbjT (DUF2867 family)